jgi:hypothetical protein
MAKYAAEEPIETTSARKIWDRYEFCTLMMTRDCYKFQRFGIAASQEKLAQL